MKKMFALMMLVGLAAGIMVGCGDTGAGVTTVAAFDTKYDANAPELYWLVSPAKVAGAYYYNQKAGKYYTDLTGDGSTADDTEIAEAKVADALCGSSTGNVADMTEYVYAPATKTVLQINYSTKMYSPCYDVDDATTIGSIVTAFTGVLAGKNVPALGYSGYFLCGMTKNADGTYTETIKKATKADMSDIAVVTGWGK